MRSTAEWEAALEGTTPGPVECIGHEEDDYDVHGDVDE